MKFQELSRPVRVLSYVLLVLLALSILYPLVWMSYTALKTNPEVMRSPFGLPRRIDFSNIRDAWRTGGFTRLYFNSLLVSIVSVLGIVCMAAAAAYPLARRGFRGSKLIHAYFLIGIAIPTQALIIPGFKLMATLDVWARALDMPFTFRNSPISLIVTYFSWTSIAIVFFYAYFRNIPADLVAAAAVDGASEWQTFRQIMIPLAMPALVTMGIFYFIWVWNDFLWPLVYVQAENWRTIPLGLMAFKGEYTTFWSLQMGALSLATWPPLILYILFRSRIQRGLTEGALKF